MTKFDVRSGCLSLVFCGLMAILTASIAAAQSSSEDSTFPVRPIKFIIPSPAGGAGDVACRLLAQAAEKILGKPIVSVNMTGASFSIATGALATSRPDGYTIGYTAMLGMLIAPHVMKVSYSPTKDFRQIIQFGDLNIVAAVKGDSPFYDVKDLIAYARQNPGQLLVGSSGATSLGQIVMHQISKRENISIVPVPFRGGPDVATALLGGQIQLGAGDISYSLIKSGQLRILFTIGEERSTQYPGIPTTKELGYQFPVPTYLSVAAPAGTPDDIARKLESAFERAMQDPSFIKGMHDLYITINHRNSNELTAYMDDAYDVYGKLLSEMGIAHSGGN